MRIFGFGNENLAEERAATRARFLSAMRIFGFGNDTPMSERVSNMSGFYPQCGFLALGTNRQILIVGAWIVSIRNADFWLWEPATASMSGRSPQCFYPQCGFLALGTADLQIRSSSESAFLSAMRIFGFGNGPPFLGH
jgi:hypothetical protein